MNEFEEGTFAALKAVSETLHHLRNVCAAQNEMIVLLNERLEKLEGKRPNI